MVNQKIDDDIAHAGLEEDRHGVSSIKCTQSSPLINATTRNRKEGNRGLLMAKVASSKVLEDCLSSQHQPLSRSSTWKESPCGWR